MVCSETYQYYNLPFCTPEGGKEYKTEGLGEVLEGDRLVNTPYSIKFRVDKENEILCSRELTAKDLKKFRKAVKKYYYFQVRTFSCMSNIRLDISFLRGLVLTCRECGLISSDFSI